MDACALHGRRQCCLANPQFLEYIATYSASEPALVPSSSSTSDSSTTTATAVDPSSTEATSPPKKSGQLSPRPASITPTSILIKARENLDVPNPQPVSRRHSSPTAVSEPLRSPPTSPPPLPTSTPNSSSTTRPMTDSTTTPIARRRTLDFAGDENSARRDSRAVNALPKPTKPIYPRAKITKFAVDSIAPDTPSSSIASSPRSRAIATSNHISKVTVTPPSKSSTPSARSPPSKGGVKFQTTKLTASKTMPTPVKLPNPTNHVHLSRKTDTIPISFFTKLFSSKSTYKKRQSDISDIRDVFVIDPELVLPRGMFRALDDSFVGLGRKDSFDDEVLIGEEHQLHHHGLALKRSRTFSGSDFRKKNGVNAPTAATATSDKKNLKLEVENGGIDVDVHLVESLDHSTKRTTIDLRLLPDENFKSGNHSLIARIHAPEKRAPFHLTARTYVLPPPPPPPPPLANEPTPSTPKTNSSVLKHHRRSASNPTSHNTNTNTNHANHPASLSTISLSSPSYNTPLPSYFSSSSPSSSSSSKSSSVLDKSNMEIQIPRSYRGPITIHVASGNLDEHIMVSREVRERSVVLREGRFARGCFVGRQEFDDDGDEEEEEENEGDDEGGEEEGGEEGGGKGEGGVCGICGGSRGEFEGREGVMDVLKKGVDVSTTPLRIVKRKPIKSFSMQNLEKVSVSASKDSPPEPQSPPSTTSITIDNNFSSPPPTTPTPNDNLTTRPSFLDTDPNFSPNHNTSDSGWKLSRNQDLNGRARRVEYRSSPLRFSMTSSVSAPHLPVLVEEGDFVAVVREGEGGEGGVGNGGKVVRVEEMSSLPSSEEEEEDGEDGDGDGDGAGTASGSVNYESAESGGSASVEELSEKTDSTIQPQPQPQQPQQSQQQSQPSIQCTCTHHQPQKRVQQRGRGVITRKKRREWIGDRIDIMIGKGMVRIRYDDEVEEGDRGRDRGRVKGRRRGGSGRWFGR